jgi:diacylglycerol kinase (ATP)
MGGVVERRLRLAGARVEVLPAASAHQMTAWCRQAVDVARDSAQAGEWHAVVAVGGDGTVHTVLQAVGTSGVPVGVVAAGSGDDAARAWGLPRARPDEAATVLLTGRTTQVDLGVSEGMDGSTTYFATVLAAGFDSRVSERSLRLESVPSALRYVVAIAAELREFRPLHYRLELDGEAWHTEGMLVAVANGPSYGGGMAVCPDADPRDGLLDVLVLRPLPTLDFMRVFPRVYRGTHLSHPAVSVRRARRVRVQAEDVLAFADGERVGPLPQTVSVVPGGLTLVGP